LAKTIFFATLISVLNKFHMAKSDQSAFVEILVDKFIIESFPQESSPYFQSSDADNIGLLLDNLRSKVVWHINHTLSKRQKEVVKLYLLGKKEAEIGKILGIKQQVVNIYKCRAINKLRNIFDGRVYVK
jgi:DNA-directed RNA polymerase specialized sigma subunit